MKTNTNLKDAPIGSRCVIGSVNDNLSIKQRLSELGFYTGAVVDKLYSGFNGSPIAFRVSGAVIALRCDDAEKIIAEI